MKAYINGRFVQKEELDSTNGSFAAMLTSLIKFYITFHNRGDEMLITFSDEEEADILDSAQMLMSNRLTELDNPLENLLTKAIQAMISTIPVNSMETLRLCTYIQSIGGKTERRKIGVLYHSFSTLCHSEPGYSFVINPIELTMKI